MVGIILCSNTIYSLGSKWNVILQSSIKPAGFCVQYLVILLQNCKTTSANNWQLIICSDPFQNTLTEMEKSYQNKITKNSTNYLYSTYYSTVLRDFLTVVRQIQLNSWMLRTVTTERKIQLNLLRWELPFGMQFCFFLTLWPKCLEV